MNTLKPWWVWCTLLVTLATASEAIDRQTIIEAHNVQRNASASTPVQVGNGNFAFGADVTGLQSFVEFNTLSSWGFHNASLPTTPGQTKISDFTGINVETHGRFINYNAYNESEPDISQWLIANPGRINLGRIGLYFFNNASTTEADLQDITQLLDIYAGTISSTFKFNGSTVEVFTVCDPQNDVLGIKVRSDLLAKRQLGLFFDFPYPNSIMFQEPVVGTWGDPTRTTTMETSSKHALIKQKVNENAHYLNIRWAQAGGSLTGPVGVAAGGANQYHFSVAGSSALEMTVEFSPDPDHFQDTDTDMVQRRSLMGWRKYWAEGAFIDMTRTHNENATELQRRIILSQYLLAVNSAGRDEVQESGLVNNGWYGKFHLEMYFWHSMHWGRWGKWTELWRSQTSMYNRFLPASYARAANQGYKGARWGKMSDPSGRSSPAAPTADIDAFLIWQQPHPTYFAEVEWRAFPRDHDRTLEKWDTLLTATADFMASYAWYNSSTDVYDLGPPVYTASETTDPYVTINPTFEIAYWRFGLDIAKQWKLRQGQVVPQAWQDVLDKLAPLAVDQFGTYPTYQGIPGMWTNPATTTSHPMMAGIYGLLPPPSSGAQLNMTVVENTAAKILGTWQLTGTWGWDFPLLAMNSLRLGDVNQAIDYMLYPEFQFDDAGYAIGGAAVPTPYMPAAGGLLLAAAMFAGGWDGAVGPHFPEEWNVVCEDFLPAM